MADDKQYSKIGIFFARNWQWIIAITISAIGAYSQYELLHYQVERNTNRLQTWIERQEKHNESSNAIHLKEALEIATLKQQIKYLEEEVNNLKQK